jgi:hypothetical protein
MLKYRSFAAALLAGTATVSPFAATAASISGWSKVNVVEGPAVIGTDGAASVVYDRVLPDAGAETNGQIYYAAPEANTPGMRVSNDPYMTGQGSFDGCLIASGSAECDSGFQSGKRFKQQFTSSGEMDLVFDVADTAGATIYQAFHRIVNLTGRKIRDFTVELGSGIGAGFTSFDGSEGVTFAQNLELGPDKKTAFSQFPFGLFGDDQQPNPNPEYTLDGFFDGDSRAGFDLDVSATRLDSDGFYGNYESLFGFWLSKEMAPAGLLWDWALGAADPLVMAWDNGMEWELRRAIDDSRDGILGTITVDDVYSLSEPDWRTYAYGDISGVEGFLGVSVFDDFIEDLANLNLNYGIVVGDNVAFDQFTLRVDVATVPLPLSAPLLAAGLGALGALRRSRRA